MPTTGNNIRANTYIRFFSLPLNVSLSLYFYIYFSHLFLFPLCHSLSLPLHFQIIRIYLSIPSFSGPPFLLFT